MFKQVKYPNSNVLFIAFISFISIIYFPFCQLYLPDKFHFDSGIIRVGLSYPQYVSGSFRSTASFFSFFGFSTNTPLVVIQVVSWIIFLLILITILRVNKSIKFSNFQLMFISFFGLMYGAYFVNYSKDIIILLFFIIAINIPSIHNNFLINIMLSIVIYGFFFRSYWLIIFIVSFVLLNNNINKHVKKYIIYICICMVLFIFVFNIVKRSQVTNLRTAINNFRINDTNAGTIARSMIHNILPNSSVFTDIINYFYVLISLIIPLQGFPSLNVIIYYLWILGIFIMFFRNKKNLDVKLFLIFFIYINVQALFEPDFGSVFRHQLAWFPIIYCALNNNIIKND